MSDVPWPFIGAEALSANAIRERGMRRHYKQLYPGVFVPRGVELSARQRAEAAWLWSKRRGVVSGQSAAALLGAKWIDGKQPAELIHDNRKVPEDLVVHSEPLPIGEVLEIGKIRVTTPARTAFDIGRHTEARGDAVRRLDALANATDVKLVDMAYQEVTLGIEYDGPQHWEDPIIRQRDIDKGVAFDDVGWHVIRVSRDLLYYRRASYVHRVQTVLTARGFSW